MKIYLGPNFFSLLPIIWPYQSEKLPGAGNTEGRAEEDQGSREDGI